MQTYLNIRATQTGTEGSPNLRGNDLARALPAGRESSGTVVQVTQSQTQPGQFTVQLQLGNRLLELVIPRPLPQGSQVLLSRDTEGSIQLRLPVNNAPQSSADTIRLQNAPAQARADSEALLLRIGLNSTQQAANLPTNQSQRGVILAQTGQPPAPATAASTTPANTGSTPAANTAGSATPTATPATSGMPATVASGTAATPSQSSATTAPATTAPASTPAPSSAPSATTAATTAPATTMAAITTNPANTVAASTTNASPAVTPATVATTTTAATAVPVSPTPVSIAVAAAVSALPTSVPAQAPTQTPTQAPPPAPLPATAAAAVSSTTASVASPTPSATQAFANTDAGARPQGFPVRVLVAGQVLDLVSPRPVQAGQQVDVTRTEQGMIRIQFLPTATPIAQQPAVQAVMQQALREVLPVQLPLADGLNQLMQISERPGARQHSALNQLIQSMLSLFSVKPGAADADKAIARNLQQGGLLSEAGLSRASSQQPPAPDLKQQLGQLLRLADTLPAQAREQLNQLVNALLARSTAQQISSLQRWRDLPDGGQERHYRLDLPIQQQQGFDNAELRITEHRRRNEQGEFVTVWSVRLHFELDSEGAVDAELSLQERYQLQASFWVEKVSTLERLRERLQPFETELKAKGFDVAPLNARLGKLANPEITPLSKRLVDVHT